MRCGNDSMITFNACKTIVWVAAIRYQANVGNYQIHFVTSCVATRSVKVTNMATAVGKKCLKFRRIIRCICGTNIYFCDKNTG